MDDEKRSNRPSSQGTTDQDDIHSITPNPAINILKQIPPEDGLPSRILSRISSRASANPDPPPDGGTRAWMCGMYELTIWKGNS